MRNISEEDIYRYYLGDLVVGDMYNSPIRNNDDTPSFQVFEHRHTGRLCWVDYGLTDQFGKDPYNLVQHLKDNIPLTHKGWYDAQRLVKREVGIGMIGKPMTKLRRRKSRDVAPYVDCSNWSSDFMRYWNRFDLSKEELIFEDVEPLNFMSWSGPQGDAHVSSDINDPAYVYWWSKNPASWKIYRPLASKRDRFRQENVDGVIEGWNSMMKSYTGLFDIFFILSSSKDRFVVKHCFNDLSKYNGVNPRGEKDRQDIINKQDEIKNVSNRQIILYDADDPGWTGAQELARETGFETYDVRGKLFGQKDFADVIDKERGNKSYRELKQRIERIIK